MAVLCYCTCGKPFLLALAHSPCSQRQDGAPDGRDEKAAGSEQAGEFPRQDSLALRTYDEAASTRERRGEGDSRACQSEHFDGPERLMAIRATCWELQLVHSVLPLSRNLCLNSRNLVHIVVLGRLDLVQTQRAPARVIRQFLRAERTLPHADLVGRCPTRLYVAQCRWLARIKPRRDNRGDEEYRPDARAGAC